MPRHPRLRPSTAALQPAVFTRLLPVIRRMDPPPILLHIGDTWLDPPPTARFEAIAPALPPSTYAYAAPNGLPALRAAWCERYTRMGLRDLDIERVHVTVGATGAVSAALHAFVEPGEEVLLLSPFWPLVRGMIVGMGATAVEVPFYARMRAGAPVAEVLGAHLSPRTTAVYLCSPNNPDGTVLGAQQLAEVAAFCVAHDLWLISDEAYADYAFAPRAHHFVANLPGMAERTATIHTASKSFALAGVRIGFLSGDPSWLEAARRHTTHVVYNVPLACQLSAQAAIEAGEDWVDRAREVYRSGAELLARRLQAPFAPAQGGGFVLVDLDELLGERDLMDYLGELIHEGVTLSPGGAFGKHWERCVRVCYMSVPEAQLEVAVDRLNRSFDRLRRGERLEHAGPRHVF